MFTLRKKNFLVNKRSHRARENQNATKFGNYVFKDKYFF